MSGLSPSYLPANHKNRRRLIRFTKKYCCDIKVWLKLTSPNQYTTSQSDTSPCTTLTDTTQKSTEDRSSEECTREASVALDTLTFCTMTRETVVLPAMEMEMVAPLPVIMTTTVPPSRSASQKVVMVENRIESSSPVLESVTSKSSMTIDSTDDVLLNE